MGKAQAIRQEQTRGAGEPAPADTTGAGSHDTHVRELLRLEGIVRSAPDIVTRKQAIEVFLDNALTLLPCDIAGVVILSTGQARGHIMSRLVPVEPILSPFTELLRRDLTVFTRAEVGNMETQVVPGPSKREAAEPEPELRSFMSMPVFTAGETVGVLGVAGSRRGVLGFGEERILSTLSTHLSLSLQQIHYQDSLQATIGELESLNNTFKRLQAALERISAAREPQEVQELVLDLALTEMQAEAGSLILVNDARQLEIVASRGLTREVLESKSYNRSDGIARWAIEHGSSLSLGPDLLQTQFSSPAGERDIAGSLVVPLRLHSRVIGALNVNRIRVRESFTPVQTEAMLLIANAAAVAIENARLHKRHLEGERIATIGMTALGIGHYIKNLNTVIQGGRRLMEDAIQARNWAALETAWGRIRRGTDKITNLAMDLLDYARPKEPRRAPTDIQELIREALEEVGPSAEHFGIGIRFSPAEDTGAVQVDRGQVHRCLLNLLTNAIDAMPQGGTLTVETRTTMETEPKAGRYVLVTVSDTGTGIPQEILPKVFLPMFSTKGSRGTGIGLAVTKKIVEEHGGRIDVETDVGKGSSFVLYFPAGI
jgi:signal transduction histidine kinase